MNANKPKAPTRQRRRRPRARRGRRKARSQNRSAIGRPFGLGDAVLKYVRLLANPFTAEVVGLPSSPAQFTRVVRSFVRGQFTAQTLNNIAWVMYSPRDGVVNDVASVWGSTAAGAAANWFVVASGSSATCASDYAAANIGTLNTQAEYRVVAAGLRIKYIGTELNRGGIIVSLQDQNHQPLTNRTLADVSSEEVAKQFQPQSTGWTTALYTPVNNGDFEMRSTLPNTPAATAAESFYLGHAIQAAGPCSFQFEAVTVAEIFGRNVRGMKPQKVDVVGFSAAHSALCGGRMRAHQLKDSDAEKIAVMATGAALQSQTGGAQSRSALKEVSDVTGDIAQTTTNVATIIDTTADIFEALFGWL